MRGRIPKARGQPERNRAAAARGEAEDLPAWKRFNAAARRHTDAVGIWHETYAVPAGHVETVYGNGAVIGLGAATGTVPVRQRGRAARERIGSRAG